MVGFSIAAFGSRSHGNDGRTLRSETVHRVQVPGNLYGVTLSGHPGLSGLLVIDTGSSPVLQRWNNQHPNQRIEAGHAILEVNGITEPKEMVEEFRTATSANLLFTTELTQKQMAVFKQSKQLHKSKALDAILQPVGDACHDICAICHDDLQSDCSQLPCGHQFHDRCVRKWLQWCSCVLPVLLSNDHQAPSSNTRKYSLTSRNVWKPWSQGSRAALCATKTSTRCATRLPIISEGWCQCLYNLAHAALASLAVRTAISHL